jgi:histidine triad (HIT) family protein
MNRPAYDDKNVFAKILRGELPAEKVYEDEHSIVIMDVMPQGKGHALVIPKAASRNIFDIAAQDLKNVIGTVQRVARAAKTAFGAQGVLIMQFNEAAATQTVFHTHFHIIPRFEGVPLKPHGRRMADAESLKADAERLRAALSNNP